MKFLSLETILKWQRKKTLCVGRAKVLKLARGRKKISWNGIMKLPISGIDKTWIGGHWLNHLEYLQSHVWVYYADGFYIGMGDRWKYIPLTVIGQLIELPARPACGENRKGNDD